MNMGDHGGPTQTIISIEPINRPALGENHAETSLLADILHASTLSQFLSTMTAVG